MLRKFAQELCDRSQGQRSNLSSSSSSQLFSTISNCGHIVPHLNTPGDTLQQGLCSGSLFFPRGHMGGPSLHSGLRSEDFPGGHSDQPSSPPSSLCSVCLYSNYHWAALLQLLFNFISHLHPQEVYKCHKGSSCVFATVNPTASRSALDTWSGIKNH